MASQHPENGRDTRELVMSRETVAILVDGAFYQKRARYLWGDKTPKDRADELISYCMRHLYSRFGKTEMVDRLYRIFYYDCPPPDVNIYNPITRQPENWKTRPNSRYQWTLDFHEILRSKRKVALRLGRLHQNGYHYYISASATKKLFSGEKKIEDLTIKDLVNNFTQKGVDMRLGLDISSMAFKKQVTKMILISGDSDFVPAAKQARREGIDFILDSLFADINDDLNEHIDGKLSVCTNPRTNPTDAANDPLAKQILRKISDGNCAEDEFDDEQN